MRNRLAALASLTAVAVLAAACAAAAPAPDAYQQLDTAAKTAWDPIQVNVGLSAMVGGTAVKLDPADIAIVIDGAGGRGAVHIAISAAELGVTPAAFARAGLAGDTIAFDLVYAADTLYVRSALLAPTLKMLLGPVGKLPAGDLRGWLKLGTKDELAALAAMSSAALPRPSAASPSADAAGTPIKRALEAAGVTLAIVGTEAHGGRDLQRIRMAIDPAKLAANPGFAAGAGGGAQASQAAAMLRSLSFAGDLWVDPGSHRVVEADLHMASASDAAQSGDVVVTAHDPDGSVALDPPASTVDIPIAPLMTELMKLISKSSES